MPIYIFVGKNVWNSVSCDFMGVNTEQLNNKLTGYQISLLNSHIERFQLCNGIGVKGDS